jgi:crossover junction endodeoxyribonuclease RuvC
LNLSKKKSAVPLSESSAAALPAAPDDCRQNSVTAHSTAMCEAGAAASGFFVDAAPGAGLIADDSVPKEETRNRLPVRRVLGIDPGLKSTGYAVIDYAHNRYRVVINGVISTETGSQKSDRLNIIYESIAAVIAEYAPTEASMETLFFARNVTSALAVSEARGVLLLCARRRHIPLYEYSPNAIKKAVSGNARADKETVRSFVRLLLGTDAVIKTDHESDAIAAAITHINSVAL